MNSDIKLYCELISKFKLKKGKTNEDVFNIIKSYDVKLVYTRFTCTQLIKKFIEAKEKEGLSENTIGSYKCTLNKFNDWIITNSISINDVNKETMRLFINFMSKSRKSSTIFHHLSVLKVFFNWLVSEGLIENNPCNELTYKQNKTFRHALNEDDIEKLRVSCRTIRDRALIEFLLTTGCRVSEVVNIREQDLDLNNNSCVVTGKGNKTRIVLYTDHCKKLLKLHLSKSKRKDDYIFCSSKFPYKKLDRYAINALLRRLANKAEIVNNIHPHLFRHTFATIALNRGMDIVSIQKLLGHDHLSTTQIYAEMNIETVKKQYKKYMK